VNKEVEVHGEPGVCDIEDDAMDSSHLTVVVPIVVIDSHHDDVLTSAKECDPHLYSSLQVGNECNLHEMEQTHEQA